MYEKIREDMLENIQSMDFEDSNVDVPKSDVTVFTFLRFCAECFARGVDEKMASIQILLAFV
jgi:hypothetical protein